MRRTAKASRAELHRGGPEAARRAAEHALQAIGPPSDAAVVAVYIPMGDELDPTPATLALHARGHRLCAPVTGAPGTPLRFRSWTPGAEVGRGRLGEAFPAAGDWEEPDALLMPLLAFDAQGWRLGYGGGFYDRTLIALRARRTVTAFGFAFAGQEVEAVPHGDMDARLDGVVTEAGVRRFA